MSPELSARAFDQRSQCLVCVAAAPYVDDPLASQPGHCARRRLAGIARRRNHRFQRLRFSLALGELGAKLSDHVIQRNHFLACLRCTLLRRGDPGGLRRHQSI
ncbi:hypothetical protein D9M73_296320 [compost metagenome]